MDQRRRGKNEPILLGMRLRRRFDESGHVKVSVLCEPHEKEISEKIRNAYSEYKALYGPAKNACGLLGPLGLLSNGRC